jgi:hypothetical protein
LYFHDKSCQNRFLPFIHYNEVLVATSTSYHRVLPMRWHIGYNVLIYIRKSRCFGINKKSAPGKKGALGARSEACSLTTTLGDRNPSPTSPHGMSGCPTSVAGVRGLYNRFSCVLQPFLAVSEPPKAFRRLALARVEPRRQRVRREWAPLGCIMRSRHQIPNGPSSPNLTHP